MRREQSKKATDPTRITVPISRAFYMSAMADVVIKGANTARILTEIIDHLRDGTFDEAIMVSTFTGDDDDDCKIEVCIDGQWYLIEIH